jgi:hypothetical protein
MAWDRNVSHETVAAIIRMADLILPGHDRLIRVVRQGQDIRFAPEGRTQVRIARAGDVPGAPREWLLSL